MVLGDRRRARVIGLLTGEQFADRRNAAASRYVRVRLLMSELQCSLRRVLLIPPSLRPSCMLHQTA